jgi:hypothetical protein
MEKRKMSAPHPQRKALATIAAVAVFLTVVGPRSADAGSMVGSDNIYFGHLHNHSNLSDGTGTPSTAYSTAQAAGLDFFGLSDHSDASNFEYQTMIDAANAANRPDVFTTFYGFEWSSTNYGHVTVVNCSQYCTTGSVPNFDALLTWLSSHSGVAFCNHPGRQDGAGTEFDHFTDPPSSAIVGMELWNKSSGFTTYYYNSGYTSDSRDRSGYFDEALLNGWWIGAAGSEDNHSGTWGSGNYRLAILAGSNTRTSLYAALQARRFYSTLDKNLELSFTVNGSQMGSSTAGGLCQCEVRAADRDGETFSKVEIIRSGYVVSTQNVSSTNPVVTVELTAQQGDYIYCKVTESDGGEAISSPVFVTSNGPDGPPRADLLMPLDNGPADLDSATDQVTVNTTQADFQIQLTDLDGVNDGSVTAATVSITGLTSGTDYSFAYDAGTDVITLAPLAGPVFGNGLYTITLSGIRDLAGETMASKVLTVRIDTTIVTPQTVRFQQGFSGYSSTADTMIVAGTPNTSYGGTDSLNVDLDSSLGGVSQVLLRFGSIIGTGTGQIPPGASISSAILRLNSLDTGNGGSLHAMLQPWSDTSTWNSLTNGVTADGTEAVSASDDSIGANGVGDADLRVTGTVQSWANGARTNNGWVVLPNGADGWHIASAEHATADYRPELIVTFVPTGEVAPVANAGTDQTVADDDGDGAEVVTLNGSQSYHPDPDRYITEYKWTWNVDGTPYTMTGSTVAASFPVGSRVVTLTVTDNMTATSIDTVTIAVNANQPPTARGGADQTVVDTDNDGFGTLTLDGSKSTDADGTIVLYEWTVNSQPVDDPENDGIVALTLPLGNYTAQLTVVDNGGLDATDTVALKVEIPSLFREDFESGGFAAGGWSTSGQTGVDVSAAHTGAYGALLKKASTLETSVASGSATAALFTYWARTENLKNGRLYVEWSANGSTWQLLNTVTSSGWMSFSHTLSLTQSSFRIRFRTDGSNASELAMVDDILVTTTAANGLPVAVGDSEATNEDMSVTVTVLANDSDPDGDTLAVTAVTAPAHGGAVLNPDSTVTYQPADNYNGDDSFDYTVSDGNGGTDTATVSITIAPVNDDPVAHDDTATTPQDTAVTILVLSNDSDVDGDGLTVTAVGVPANGAVENRGNSVTYTPNAGYTGEDSFSYTISDGQGGTATALVAITITGSGTTPTVSVQSITTNLTEAKKYTATAFVVLDPALEGATVVGDWYFKGVLRASGTTATFSNGGYLFTSPETPAKPGDQFVFHVTNVLLSGYQFAPDPDKDTATITVGP